nr:hypothetical protein Iba_chr14dCG5810 [Ipomoea batatas]GME03038.1 hypothetical protein Iba_scaffold392CG0070 [Ipomoea batatas]
MCFCCGFSVLDLVFFPLASGLFFAQLHPSVLPFNPFPGNHCKTVFPVSIRQSSPAFPLLAEPQRRRLGTGATLLFQTPRNPVESVLLRLSLRLNLGSTGGVVEWNVSSPTVLSLEVPTIRD